MNEGPSKTRAPVLNRVVNRPLSASACLWRNRLQEEVERLCLQVGHLARQSDRHHGRVDRGPVGPHTFSQGLEEIGFSPAADSLWRDVRRRSCFGRRSRNGASRQRGPVASGATTDFRQVTTVLDRRVGCRRGASTGHVVHGRKLGRELGFKTLNLRFAHWKPAASGIFAVEVHGLGDAPLAGVANLGIRPSLDANDVNGGRVLLETHCLEWPAGLGPEGAYGKIIRVELLHKLHDELKYDGLEALTQGIRKDCDDARAFFASTRRQTTRDRI